MRIVMLAIWESNKQLCATGDAKLLQKEHFWQKKLWKNSKIYLRGRPQPKAKDYII